MVSQAVAIGGKGLFMTATPFGRWNLYITIIVLVFLVVYGGIQAVKQKDVYPLFDTILFRVVGADHKISQSLDEINPVLTEGTKFFDVFNSRWWAKAWATFVLYLDIFVALWFMWIVIFALYKLFQGLNNTNPLMNVGYAIVLFAIIQLVVGLAMYPTLMAGKTMSDDKVAILNDAVVHSYPFEGMVKLVKRIATSSLFDKTYAFLLSDSGQLVSNVPTTYINDTGV